MIQRIRRCSRVASLALALAAGCASPNLPDSPATITGIIVARGVPMSSGEMPTVLVRERVSDECGIVFALAGADLLAERASGAVEEVDLDALAVGVRVRVWATGVVASSCPAQGRASTVVVVR